MSKVSSTFLRCHSINGSLAGGHHGRLPLLMLGMIGVAGVVVDQFDGGFLGPLRGPLALVIGVGCAWPDQAAPAHLSTALLRGHACPVVLDAGARLACLLCRLRRRLYRWWRYRFRWP